MSDGVDKSGNMQARPRRRNGPAVQPGSSSAPPPPSRPSRSPVIGRRAVIEARLEAMRRNDERKAEREEERRRATE